MVIWARAYAYARTHLFLVLSNQQSTQQKKLRCIMNEMNRGSDGTGTVCFSLVERCAGGENLFFNDYEVEERGKSVHEIIGNAINGQFPFPLRMRHPWYRWIDIEMSQPQRAFMSYLKLLFFLFTFFFGVGFIIIVLRLAGAHSDRSDSNHLELHAVVLFFSALHLILGFYYSCS